MSSTNSLPQVAEYYALEPDDGLTMNLGVNPLIQSPLEAYRRSVCRNILNDIAMIRYVPFESEMIGNPVVKVIYELNGNEVLTFYPYETWCDGKHLLSLFYPFADLQPNVTNRFRVFMVAESSGGVIDTGNVVASICGQSMAALAEWDGKIAVEQRTGRFLFAENLLRVKACRDAKGIVFG